ncbi:unnamed protein product [Euphydryas editha]|uniref:Uncharacterized protein n=1 Tax=Euphydryas editha TaxID=104508 RepID=A0AAU9VDN6_EUPED|nr:unnamed protein product [Euphydryas editha]
MSHESIDNQQIKCTQNLPFEVIAVPQYNDSQLAENYLIEPINIKIRIRNKNEVEKHGTISVPKLPSNCGRKVRIVSSDQTIMSFNLLMEPEISKKKEKKIHKNIFHIFRPGGCLKIQNDNDDKYPYLPSSKYKLNTIRSTNSTSIVEEPSNIISEKLTLKKNFPSIAPIDRHFMGKCKPGGCLDPPFGEDEYSYKPITKMSNIGLINKDKDRKDFSIRETTTESLNPDVNVKENTLQINEKFLRTQLDNYQENSIHSLITYPTTPSDSDVRKHNNSRNIKINKRISSEDKGRISVKEFSEIYFMPKKDKTKNFEKLPFENIDNENVTAIENKNNKHYFINQDELEASSTLVLKTDSSLTNNGSRLKLCTEKNKKDSATKNLVRDIDDLTRLPEIAKSIEMARNVHTFLRQSHCSYVDKDTTDKVKANNFSSNNNTSISSTEIQIKKSLVPDYISEDAFIKESENISNKNKISDMSFLNKGTNNVETSDSRQCVAIPATKTKNGDQSIEVSQNSLKFEVKEVLDVAIAKIPLQGKDLGPNDDSDYNIVGSKDVRCLNNKRDEYLSEKIRQSSYESTATQSQNKEVNGKETNNIKNYSIIQSNGSSHTNTTNITLQNYQKISETTEINKASQKLETIENLEVLFDEPSHCGKSFETDNIFLKKSPLQSISGDISNIEFETLKPMDILSIERDDYNATDINVDKNETVDIVSDDNNLKLVPITTMASHDIISEMKFNSISLIQNKTDEINHRSFNEERKVSIVEKIQEMPLSESLKKLFDSEAYMGNNSGRSFDKLNKRTGSVVHNIFDPIMADNKDKTSLDISKVVENVEDDYKSVIKITPNASNKELSEKLESNYPVHQEDGLDMSTYSSIAIDFGFGYSVDKYNKLTIKTFDTSIPLHKNDQDKISIIKSIIRVNGDDIIIPINFDTNLIMQITKANVTNKGAISIKRKNSSDNSIKMSSDSIINKNSLLEETLNALFENLFSLNTIIENLKAEANALSFQQISLEETLKRMEKQPKRLIHTYSQCGCEKK